VAADPESSVQVDVDPAPVFPVKATLTVVLGITAPFVGEVIVSRMSPTVIVVVAQPVFPDVSVAQTVKVWVPKLRPAYDHGEVQAVATPESILHVVVTGEEAVTLNTKLPEPLLTLPFAGWEMTTCGGGPPTLKEIDPQPMPATFVAHTVTVCAPLARFV
jgi:hypothetical protein